MFLPECMHTHLPGSVVAYTSMPQINRVPSFSISSSNNVNIGGLDPGVNETGVVLENSLPVHDTVVGALSSLHTVALFITTLSVALVGGLMVSMMYRGAVSVVSMVPGGCVVDSAHSMASMVTVMAAFPADGALVIGIETGLEGVLVGVVVVV